MADKGSTGRAIGEEVINLGGSAVYANYSRDDESEADRSGLDYAYRAGYDPYGSIRLHQLLNGSSDFFSSHPSSAERIAALTTKIAYLSNPQSQVARTTSFSPRPTSSYNPPTPSYTPPTPSYTPPTTVLSSPKTISTSTVAKNTRADGDSGSGVVLKVKSRYRYFIASQTGFKTPIKGATVIVNAGGRNISGTVERVVNGYFSVLVSFSIDDTIIGQRVTF
jgi:hypothetical protein